jgi:hypothetical protein
MNLFLLTVATACIVAARSSIRRDGLEVNHVLLFTSGFLFYWMLPLGLGSLRLFEDQAELKWWYQYFDRASTPGQRETYLLFTLLIYLSFAFGSLLGSKVRARADRVQVLPFAERLLEIYLPVGMGLACWYGWKLRTQLFTGYAGEYTAGGLARGTLSATSLLLLSLVLLKLAYAQRAGRLPRTPLAVLSDKFFLAYVAVAVALLSLGVRLYVVTAVLICVTFYSVYEARISYRRALTVAAGLTILAGSVGLVRVGASVSPMGVAANLFAEPLFTSFSLLDFIGEGDLPLWNYPRFLIGDLVNLLPTALFPNKAEFLPKFEDYGYTVFTPVGALNSFFSLMVNFGLLGAMLFLCALGFLLGALKRRSIPLAQVTYSMLTGWLAFSFFRDGFSVSIVKNMLEFSILVPWAIAVSLHVATVAARGGGARSRTVAAATPQL